MTGPGSGASASHPPTERSDLRFRVTDLRRRTGTHHSEQRVVDPGYLMTRVDEADGPAASLQIGDVSVAEQPVRVQVDLESLTDGVGVRATVDFAWEGPCRRCLGPATGESSAQLVELFVDDPGSYSDGDATESAAGYSEESDSGPRPLRDGWLDLGEPVRETVLLGLPLAPLCDEDCEGPLPARFPVSVEEEDADAPGDTDAVGDAGSSRQTGPSGDPRWAALDELHFDPEDH